MGAHTKLSSGEGSKASRRLRSLSRSEALNVAILRRQTAKGVEGMEMRRGFPLPSGLGDFCGSDVKASL